MHRADGSPLARLRGIGRTRGRAAARAVTLVLALLGAPASSALRSECDLCPRTCPMHQRRDAIAERPRLNCHGSAQHSPARTHPGERIARPPCGNHGIVSATALPPIILARAPRYRVVLVTAPAPHAAFAAPQRLAEPPETPPPILPA